MPHRLRKTIGYIWPKWLLPLTVILKTLKTDWDDEEHYPEEKERERKLELQREILTYQAIKPFQGVHYPLFYGEIEVVGIPGIALSDIGGTPLCDVDPDELSVKRLRELVDPPIRELVARGIEPTDLKLDNFHFIKGPLDRVMMFDFGDVDHRRSDDDIDAICKELVDEVVRRYKRTQKARRGLVA